MIRPPFRPRNPIKCIGPYTGAAVDERVDWDEIGKDCYDHGYNQISVFLTTAFHNHLGTFYPWPLVGSKYDYSRLNPIWRAHIAKMFDRLAFWRITPHICFVDQFHDYEYSKKDPFRQGLGSGNDWDRWLENALYNSWDGDKYRWIKWDEPSNGNYTNFKTTSPFGAGMNRYVGAVVAEAKKVLNKKAPNGNPLYPDFQVSWKWGNETFAYINEDGSTDNSKGRGDRDEIYVWIKEKFKTAGFIEGKNIFSYFDFAALIRGRWDFHYPTMDIAFRKGIRGRHKARIEIHHMLTLDDIKDMESKGKVDWRYAMHSTDGDLKMIADYSELGHSKYHTDLKLDVKKGEPYFPLNWMQFWRTYFPRYYNYVK